MKTFLWLALGLVGVWTLNAHADVEFSDRNFAKLYNKYQESVVSPLPWASFWYPYGEDGIADRWNGRPLSPAEKYDQINGTSADSWELNNHGTAINPPDWFGHCNGWSTAAILTPEPRKSKTIDGVKLDVADRKALLIEAYQDAVSDFIGSRVWDEGDEDSDAFWDIVPAQFHLLLTNLVGKEKRSFIIDKATGHEVWNQPVVGYKMENVTKKDYLGEHPEYPGIYRVNVTMRVFWANDEDVSYHFITPKFDMKNLDERAFGDRVLKYELWLDGPIEFDAKGEMKRSGNIITGWWDGIWVGGIWKNSSLELLESHPDFAWVVYDYADNYEFGNPWIDRPWTIRNIGAIGEKVKKDEE